MKSYSVSLPWHASVTVKVKAQNPKEALEKAIEEAWPSLCHQCTNAVELGEMDESCEPEVLEISK